MLENLFLIRDIFYICNLYNINDGVISIDQEKAFDHANHSFLFAILQAWIKLLYNDVRRVVC